MGTLKPLQASDEFARQFALIGVTICLLTGAAFYFYLTGAFALLHKTPDWNVVINGVTVDGEVLAGRAFAVVTRRDKPRNIRLCSSMKET